MKSGWQKYPIDYAAVKIMDELLNLMRSCSWLFTQYGFKFVDSATSESFANAAIRLARGGVTFHFVRDRSQIFLHVGVIEDAKVMGREYSMGLVRRLLTGDREASGLMDEENIAFLKANMDEIISRFTWGNVDETMGELKRLEKLRVRGR